jgi:RHS repeat-associated protein
MLIRASKLFELSNHLGNVLATVSDKKIQHTTDNSTVDYYTADVIGANDYYAFGMGMPGRSYNNGGYRYGFNGKENDNEVKGTGDQIDYGARAYDPRIGRFFSVDPLFRKFPELSPYQYASNRPIDGIDLDGREYVSHMEQYKYNGSAWDYLKWIPNAVGDVYNAAVDMTWNSGVHTVKDLQSGNYVKNLKTQVNQVATGLKQTAVNTWKDAHAPLGQQLEKAGQTLADPSTWETGLSIYILAKIPLPGGSPKGNLLRPITGAATTELSTVETKIIGEANSILNSKQFEIIQRAYKTGTEATVKIGDRIINYSPETPGSSLTMHASPFHEGSGFQLGPKAFGSEIELKKTFIQELYRLNTQNTGMIDVDLTKPYTDAAFQAGEKLSQYVIKK